MSHSISQLNNALQQLNLSLSPTACEQLERYLQLLVKWNSAYNLTAIRQLDEMWVKHIFDSLAVLPYLQGERLLDVGTGAGIPGVILAIANPQQQWTVLDSNAKKIRFIQQALLELALPNVTAVCSRVEHLQSSVLFDGIISRAYSDLQLFCQQTLPLLQPSGQLYAMKGQVPTQELAALTMPTLQLARTVPLTVPFLDAERHLLIFEKQSC